jgi:formamidopyrimidine-DNA glycosylase
MPELPEVEVVRRRIEGYLAGKTILEVSDFQGRFALLPLSGKRIERISRHGKCLFFEFSTQDALFVHLGMTGKLLLSETRTPLPHQHLVFSLSAGIFLSFCDQRKFGKIRYFPAQEKEDFLHSLGIDPFSPAYTFERVAKLLSGKKRIKDFLLDQRKIAGIGNIYSSEILFQSRIHPERKLATLSVEEKHRLFDAIPTVLEEAIRCQGTTIRDFTGADGSTGTFQDCLAVYGRAGKPCLRCGNPIERKVLGSRSTYFCSHCQR